MMRVLGRATRWKKSWRQPAQRSLRRMILSLLLPALFALMLIGQWLTYRTVDFVTDTAYDRVLLGSLRAIEGGVSWLDGQVNILVPYAALEMYETISESKMYYRITTENNTLLTGYADLPLPPKPLQPDTPLIYEGTFQQDQVRVVAYWKPLYQEGAQGGVKIYVAERLQHRDDLVASVWRTTVGRDALFILAAVLTIIGGITLALRPLRSLKKEIEARASNDLTPLATDSMPREVLPLVETVNHHIKRSAAMTAAQADFLADASHQLRTPLAILQTQAEYALRSHDVVRMHEALRAIVQQLEQTSRLTQQLLSLARAQQPESAAQESAVLVDAWQLTQDVAQDHLQEARQKFHDFGLDDAMVDAPLFLAPQIRDPLWIREALSNLVHNAIVYTPSGGRITVSARRQDREVWLTVEDNGPGIPEADWARVFERFVRLDHRVATGSGLGLAITKALVQRSHGHIVLAQVVPHGLKISLVLPAA